MKYHRLVASLPALPLQPEPPPLALGELVAMLREELTPAHWRLAEGLIARIDVANVEALLMQRGTPPDPRGVFEPGQLTARGGASLPDFLADPLRRQEEGALARAQVPGLLWQGYCRHLVALAEEAGSQFLRDWVAFELPLLSSLAALRAERLGVDAGAERLDEPPAPSRHDDLLARLADEPDPQARERQADNARLLAIESFSGIDPFAVDAVLAYLASSLILDRWDLPRTASAETLLEVFA